MRDCFQVEVRKRLKAVRTVILLAAIVALHIFALPAAAASKAGTSPSAGKPSAKQPSPVTDSGSSEYVPAPYSDDDSFVDETILLPVLDPFVYDPALMPLSIPSSELGEVLPQLVTDFAPATGFDPLVLTDLRRKVDGTIFFEDKDRNIIRAQPKNSGPRRLFHGSQPAADPAGKRIIFVDWDLKSFFLYIYDVATNERKKIYSSPDLLSMPSFSPDGNSVAFISAPITGGSQVFVKIDLATGKSSVMAKNLGFYSYSWNPADSSIWMMVRSCPDGIAHKSFCYARIVPGVGGVKYDSISVKDSEKGTESSFDFFRKIEIRFSKKSRLLIFDKSGESDYFFDVDIKSAISRKIYFKQPDGKLIMPRELQWGPDGESIAFNYDGCVWLKIPSVDQPFPLANGFSVLSAAVWVP